MKDGFDREKQILDPEFGHQQKGHHAGNPVFFLGPDATGEDGFLITTPGECLTDAQVDDICCKSKEVWERQAAARSKNGLDPDLKRPLHQPILISRG
ncbi:hypothetical protein MBM_08097 [Drepanopeziza brunnea f. sp. 'multigermtubi' MB_m1]|uniref:Uncharacterized protein n=1 Tax=Marssonina brunnea f. sp. multigermtubi (strain MB_m1) TaxID=1072389 RepID=K1WLY0_MARBU|nr:uncharacterized protein MBM_08097 [Drepanopeziza brunnea f. sp. 'multigermtubi' MB_m1]EKD13896.1 hypothetical protein MBM_08097 [Drepanopeziza brunnea f. sp. 'multigermtubi' MB_m1]